MRTLPVAVMAASAAAAGSGIAVSEAAHFTPITTPVHIVGEALKYGVVDRLEDVGSTVGDVFGNPDVFIGQAPVQQPASGHKHSERVHTPHAAEPATSEAASKPESYDWLLVKVAETIAFGFALRRLGRFALRRWWWEEPQKA